MKQSVTNLKSFYHKCVRVWKILKKPSRQEFQMVAKISALGILVIGFLGFLISIIMKMFVQ